MSKFKKLFTISQIIKVDCVNQTFIIQFMLGKNYFILFSLLLISCTASNEIKSEFSEDTVSFYQVLRIVDGDTVVVKYKDEPEYVRIIGIDAPEKEECFSSESAERLSELIGRKTVILEPKSDEDRDKYDRLLRYILSDGKDIGAELIKEGYARNYSRFPHLKLKEYEAFEQKAREDNLGLWRECN